MKIKPICVTNLPDYDGVIRLKHSAYIRDIDLCVIEKYWDGFYTKIMTAKEVAEYTDADYILFMDAHDVLFVDTLDRMAEYIEDNKDYDCIFSTEKACWPDSSLATEYPYSDSNWKYLNSGLYLFKPDILNTLISSNPPYIGIDDQLYFTKLFLEGKMKCKLDTNCDLFQSLAFDDGKCFSWDGKVFRNEVTGTKPVLIHGNGKTDMSMYY